MSGKHYHSVRHQNITHVGYDTSGWVEGITSLKEEHPATELLAEDPTDMKPVATAEAPAPVAAEEDLATPLLSAEEEFDATLDLSLGLLAAEVEECGEMVLEVGAAGGWGPTALTAAQLDIVLQRLEATAQERQWAVVVLRRHTIPAPPSSTTAAVQGEWQVADVTVRRRAGSAPAIEVRVAVIGNVDSGKSTMVGVLTRSMLDDGRGLARSKVFKHHHEENTGRTSSIGQHNLCIDAEGNILNDTTFRNNTCGDYVQRAAKVITLVDLAGHEKYFRTTAYGLTGHLPDYACLMVGANMGLVGMCKEHLGVALALKVPVFFVVTKTDICPEHVLKATVSELAALLKKPGVKKRPFLVRRQEDVLLCARNMNADSLAPIFLTSAVTGAGLELIRLFTALIPQRQRWAARARMPAEFIIDETFSVPGVGTVVAGTMKRGVIATNSSLLLGPDIGDGSFRPAAIKSIHYKRLPVNQVVAGQTAALALKKVKRNQVRKGMVLVDERLHPRASWEFDADIAVLTHSTTIQPRYQAVIHCEIIRQAARVVAMDCERLRSGDRACVRFRFLQRPEYVTPGTRFVFREGRTKGIGVVVESADAARAVAAAPAGAEAGAGASSSPALAAQYTPAPVKA